MLKRLAIVVLILSTIPIACGGGGGGSGSPASGSYSHVWVAALNNGGQVVLRMNTSSSNSYYGVIEITGAGSCMDGTYTSVLSITLIGGDYSAGATGADGTAAALSLYGTYDPQTLTIYDGGLQVQRSGAGFGGSPYCDPQYNLVIALQ